MLHNPILTIDTVILHWNGKALSVLLEKRDKQPFENAWAVPGGFVHTNEDKCLASARDRIVREKVGFEPPYFEKIDSIGDSTRDPRGWAVSVIYLGILSAEDSHPKKKFSNLKFVSLEEVLAGKHDLAFDHVEIIRAAFSRIAVKCGYSSIPLWFLPKEFTVPDLIDVHAAFMNGKPNKVSVLKRYVTSGIIEPVIDEKTRKPLKIVRPAGPKATLYRHNLLEPVNFAGVMGSA